MIGPEQVRSQTAPRADDSAGPPKREIDDPGVLRALEEYVKALEEGRNPDRNELLGQFPEVAHELSVWTAWISFATPSHNYKREYPGSQAPRPLPARLGRSVPWAITASFTRSAAAGWGWFTKPSRSRSAAAWH